MSGWRPSGAASHRRHLLGLWRQPGRLAVAIFRLPLKAYQHDAGPAVGRTFLAFAHIGRRTGQSHQAVALVLRYVEASGEAVICGAWGPQSGWYRNLRLLPATQVQLAAGRSPRSSGSSTRTRRSTSACSSARAHPHRLHLLSTILGWGDLRDDARVREFVRPRPFVAFRPTDTLSPEVGPSPER
jgi:hypothetical protein